MSDETVRLKAEIRSLQEQLIAERDKPAKVIERVVTKEIPVPDPGAKKIREENRLLRKQVKQLSEFLEASKRVRNY